MEGRISDAGSIAERIRERFALQREEIARRLQELKRALALPETADRDRLVQNIVNIGAFGPNAVSYAGLIGAGEGALFELGAEAAAAPNGPVLRVADRSVFRFSRTPPVGPLRFDERYRTTTDTLFGLDRTLRLAVLADRADADLVTELNECEARLAAGLDRLGLPQREWRRVDVDRTGNPAERSVLHDTPSDGRTPAFVLRVPEAPAHPDTLKGLITDLAERAPVIVQVAGASLGSAVGAATAVLATLEGPRMRPGLHEFAVRARWDHIEGGERPAPPDESSVDGICSGDPIRRIAALQAVRASDFDSWTAVLGIVATTAASDAVDEGIAKTALAIAAQSDAELDLWIGAPGAASRDFTPGPMIGREHFDALVIGLLRKGWLPSRPRLKNEIRTPHLRELVERYLRHGDDWNAGERLYGFASETVAPIAWRSHLAHRSLLTRADFLHPLDWAGLHRVELGADIVERLTELDPEKRQLIRFVGDERTLETLRSENLVELRSVARRPIAH